VFYLLQNDGDLVYTTNTGTTYTTLTGPGGAVTYIDMAQDRNTGRIYIVDNSGRAHWIDTTSGTPSGSWTSGTGNTGDAPVAIAVNEIPEFSDYVIPIAASAVVVFVGFYRRKRK
jgi:hypothetical protein